MEKPEIFSKHNKVSKASAERFFAEFGDFLNNSFNGNEISLLDIGSGCGTILSEVIVKNSGLNFSKVIGVDKSIEMVKFSNRNFGNELLSFQYMDVEGEIPENLKNQQFDIITSFYCFYWVRDHKKAFKNIYSLLKPGGKFCCVSLLETYFAKAFDLVAPKFPIYMNDWKLNFTPMWHEDDPDTIIKEDLAQLGFNILYYESDASRNERFINIDYVMNLCRSIEPFSKKMPDNIKTKFFEELKKIFLLKQDGDNIVFPKCELRTIVEKSTN